LADLPRTRDQLTNPVPEDSVEGWTLANSRGKTYLEYAQRYFDRGDYKNALSTCEEGIILAGFSRQYLAVKEQLADLKAKIQAKIESCALG
jgi:hypothetical protein